jgi:tetratricopeptide (TPR) repeat protein
LTTLEQASTDLSDISMTDQAKALLQSGDPAAALAIVTKRLADHPKDAEALYVLAVCQRFQAQIPSALKTLDQLLEAKPGFGRAFQEQGYCYRALGRDQEALQAFKRAVAGNPALIASWKILSDVQRRAGRFQEANMAKGQLDWLTSLPRELVSVLSFLHEGRLYKSEQLCRAYLQAHGHDVEAMRLLADLGTRFYALEDAEFLLESCVELQPSYLMGRYDYVRVLNRRQKFERALEEAEKLHELVPDNPHFKLLVAHQKVAIGKFDDALAIYDEMTKALPNDHNVSLTHGHALKTVGRQGDAIQSYRRAYGLKPDLGDAFWSLANLKTYRFTDAEIAQMQAGEAARHVTTPDRYHLCFALGKAFEDRGDYGQSFDYYDRGNVLKRDELNYSAERMSTDLAAQIEHCTSALFKAKHGAGHAAPDPIFIVGLPRAGSTLLEQILASHSQVDGTLELPNILALAHKLDGRRRVDEEAIYPANLSELSLQELEQFGQAYIAETAIHRKGAPFFIDKMPNNFRHMILPNAKIIDARRGAMGCCFSGFKQLFAEGQEFTYGLEEIGHYYRDYVALMDHWDRVLPGKVLRVNYEDVVADIEPQVRRMLDFCGLPFEEGCISFHKNDRAVRTASSEQVRQPIFTSGLDQWENFSPYLDPLRQVLGPELALG